MGLCNPVYAFGSAVVSGLGPGLPVPESLLGLRNPVYALKSAIIAGLGPGSPVSTSPDLLNPVYALRLVTIVGLGPGSSAREFLPFLDPIHSPKCTGSPPALADLNPVLCSYAVKRFEFDTSVTSYFSVVLISLCGSLFVRFPNDTCCCAQEFFFMNYLTS